MVERARRSFTGLGSLCRALGVGLLVLSALGTPGTPRAETRSPEQWGAELREHTGDAALARLRLVQAREATDPDQARAYLREAAELDPHLAAAHERRARLDLAAGRSSAIGEALEGLTDHFRGYSNQSRLAANALVVVDLSLGFALVWLVVVSLLRYLPYAHHQLSNWALDLEHRKRRSRVLWIGLLAPFAAAASWGLMPLLALALPVVWIYADRRSRAWIGVVLGFLALQVVWTRPFGTLLAGADPESRVSLVHRAGYESPSPHLLSELDAALARRPGDADLLRARGLARARRGDFEASSADLLAALASRPHDAIATNNLAANHYFLGDLDRAVAGFQRTVSLDSTLATPYYNLSQSYTQKLFLKEGSLALQQAMRRGFALTEQVESLPQGAVYFVRPSALELWRLAYAGGDATPVFEGLGRHAAWLGLPPSRVGPGVVGLLLIALACTLASGRRRRVFECVNCGGLACAHCKGEHEGAVLCTGCAGTARRAKSEMVLQTLLRNRRRDAETAYIGRIRRLDAWLPGAGQIVDGMRRRGLVSAVLLGFALTGLVLGTAPVRSPWDFAGTPPWSTARILGAALLALVWAVNGGLRANVRQRHLQPHPSSEVSLARLIEGRPPRARAGGGA